MTSSTFYFTGPNQKEWLAHKKSTEGVWRYSEFNHSDIWLTRAQIEDKYPGFYVPNLQED